MARRSRRVWFGIAVVGLIAVAIAAHFLGGGLVDTLRAMHGRH